MMVMMMVVVVMIMIITHGCVDCDEVMMVVMMI